MALSLASMCWASGGIVSNCRKYIIPAPPSHSPNNVSFDVPYFFFVIMIHFLLLNIMFVDN